MARIAAQSDLTLEELRRELAKQRGLAVGYGTVWRFCDREMQSYKKHCTPSSKTGRECQEYCVIPTVCGLN